MRPRGKNGFMGVAHVWLDGLSERVSDEYKTSPEPLSGTKVRNGDANRQERKGEE